MSARARLVATRGAVTARRGGPSRGAADFEAALATIKSSASPIKMGPIATPVCDMLMVQDPDGNTVIIHKRKPGHR